MGAQDRTYAGYLSTPAFALTTSAANETTRWIAPSGLVGSFLQANFATALYGPAEVWRPVAICFQISTTTTVTTATLALRKNGVNVPAVAPSGTAVVSATVPVAASSSTETLVALNYTNPTADAPGDAWSLFVSATSTAGVVNCRLYYFIKPTLGISDGVLI